MIGSLLLGLMTIGSHGYSVSTVVPTNDCQDDIDRVTDDLKDYQTTFDLCVVDCGHEFSRYCGPLHDPVSLEDKHCLHLVKRTHRRFKDLEDNVEDCVQECGPSFRHQCHQ
jgi:hypothetical protein